MKLLLIEKPINQIYAIKVVEKNEDITEIGSYCFQAAVDGDNLLLTTDMYLNMKDCRQISKVRMKTDSFQPIESSLENISPDISYKLSAEYEKNKVKLTAHNQGKKFSHKVSFSGSLYDNLQILYLLRFIDFSEDRKAVINVLSLETGKIIETKFQYICNENITINGQSIECARISIESKDMNTSLQYALYSNDKERKLIRWTFLNQCIEIKL